MACLRHQSERFVEVYAADHAWSWTTKIDNMSSNTGYKKKICYYYDGMLKFTLLSSLKVIRLICVFISSSVAHKRFDTAQRKWLINRFVFRKSVRHQSCHLLNSSSLYKYFEVPHQNQGRTIRVYTCGPIYLCEDIFQRHAIRRSALYGRPKIGIMVHRFAILKCGSNNNLRASVFAAPELICFLSSFTSNTLILTVKVLLL